MNVLRTFYFWFYFSWVNLARLEQVLIEMQRIFLLSFIYIFALFPSWYDFTALSSCGRNHSKGSEVVIWEQQVVSERIFFYLFRFISIYFNLFNLIHFIQWSSYSRFNERGKKKYYKRARFFFFSFEALLGSWCWFL